MKEVWGLGSMDAIFDIDIAIVNTGGFCGNAMVGVIGPITGRRSR